jgi:hypothetical protein
MKKSSEVLLLSCRPGVVPQHDVSIRSETKPRAHIATATADG